MSDYEDWQKLSQVFVSYKSKWYFDSKYITSVKNGTSRNGYVGTLYGFDRDINNNVSGARHVYGICSDITFKYEGSREATSATVTEFHYYDMFEIGNSPNTNNFGNYVNSQNSTHLLFLCDVKMTTEKNNHPIFRYVGKYAIPTTYIGEKVPKTLVNVGGNNVTYKCIIDCDGHVEYDEESQTYTHYDTYIPKCIVEYMGTETQFKAQTCIMTLVMKNNDGGGIIVRSGCIFEFTLGSIQINLAARYENVVDIQGTLIARKLYIK